MDNKRNILIVDDDVKFSGELADKIKEAGLDVFVARSGKEALDYLVDHKVDFIILDFIMPEMDGYTFHHILTHDMRKQIPTIVLTSLTGSQDKEQNLEVFVKADTDLHVLVDKIKTHLDTHQS